MSEARVFEVRSEDRRSGDGGGGHARVGVISFGVTEEEAARKAARDIAVELRASVRATR